MKRHIAAYEAAIHRVLEARAAKMNTPGAAPVSEAALLHVLSNGWTRIQDDDAPAVFVVFR